MTNLTDKWKKGELIEGKKYYCESKNIVDIFEAECCCKGQNDEWWKLKNEKYCFNNVYHKNDIKVLAPVLSYDETTKLKGLLKECKRQFEEVELYRYDVADTDQEDWFKISTEQAGIANKMIAKINQLVGED